MRQWWINERIRNEILNIISETKGWISWCVRFLFSSVSNSNALFFRIFLVNEEYLKFRNIWNFICAIWGLWLFNETTFSTSWNGNWKILDPNKKLRTSITWTWRLIEVYQLPMIFSTIVIIGPINRAKMARNREQAHESRARQRRMKETEDRARNRGPWRGMRVST